jgi:hypothetical protein
MLGEWGLGTFVGIVSHACHSESLPVLRLEFLASRDYAMFPHAIGTIVIDLTFDPETKQKI